MAQLTSKWKSGFTFSRHDLFSCSTQQVRSCSNSDGIELVDLYNSLSLSIIMIFLLQQICLISHPWENKLLEIWRRSKMCWTEKRKRTCVCIYGQSWCLCVKAPGPPPLQIHLHTLPVPFPYLLGPLIVQAHTCQACFATCEGEWKKGWKPTQPEN